MSSKRDPKRYLKYLAAERNAILLYSALADQATGDRREALLELVEIEAQHAQHCGSRPQVATPGGLGALAPRENAIRQCWAHKFEDL